MRRLFPLAVGLTFLCLAPPAHAGHPMLSEDTGTQGTGNYELELGYDWSRQDRQGGFLFQPQLSYGATPALDLIVQPSWLTANSDPGHLHGFGDTNLDFKWRFYGAAPVSLGIRTGLELATAAAQLGLPHGTVSPHAILVATADLTPLTINLNAGYAHSPDSADLRTSLWHFSAAATLSFDQRLYYVLDTSLDSNPAPVGKSYQAVALVGLIYTMHPGLDIDLGYRGRLTPVGPAQQFLLGITVRGALWSGTAP